MADYTALAASYIDTWNERDPAARKEAVGKLWTVDGSYTDPLTDAHGADAIDSAIGAAQEMFPGMTFRLAGGVDGHHDQCRFSWELGPADGAAPVAGSDVMLIASDGRVQAVLGFLDRVPASQ
jgi:hypothetical protein